ncbi:unnamed protein product [Rotaria socialis]|nr:unnamed protein product [Rotaria socialis]
MSIEEFIKLKQNVGGLISFNSFLSTSADEHVSRQFALSSLDDPSLKAIFYAIDVDLALTSSPVGYLSKRLSYFYDEQEYLWDMNAIFRICEVQEVENGVCQVNLTTTSENDSQLKQLTDYMRREIGILSGMQRLGYLMTEMGEWSKAKDIYETLLQEEEDPCIIQRLGFIAHQMGDLDAALRYYQHSLSIFETLLSPNDPELATIYGNVGCVLNDKGHLEDALEQFKRTLELQSSVEKPNKLHIARTYNNIATVHDKEGRQKEALENMRNALRIFRGCLPSTHPEIAASLGNIGTIYYKNEQYSKAMSYYEKCLSIQEASLPSNHPDIVRTTGLMKQTFGQIKLSGNVLKKVVSSYSEAHEETSSFVQPFSGSVMASFQRLRNFCCCNPHTGQVNKCSRYLAWGLVCLVLTTVGAILYLLLRPITPDPHRTSVSLQTSNNAMLTSVKNQGTRSTITPSPTRPAKRALLLTDNSYVDAKNALANYMLTTNVTLTVLYGAIENYTGVPNAKIFNVVILFSPKWFAIDMPIAGQQTILNAQQAGTGVVLTEWASWRVHQQKQWHILASLCLTYPSGYAFVPHITFTNLMQDHPLWNALPTTFTSVTPISTSTNYVHGTETMLVAKCEICGGGQLGVVVQDQSDQGKGRIVQINHAIHTNGSLWDIDRNITQLIVNAVNWAAKST